MPSIATDHGDPSTFKPSDPAHPDQANTNHTNKDGEKPTTFKDAIADPSFLPTLDDAPLQAKVASHSILIFLVVGGVVGSWFLGFDLFQLSDGKSWLELGGVLGGVSVVLIGALFWTGTANVDFKALLDEFWWLTLPIVMMAGLALVMLQERQEPMQQVE
jgi:hypothetical protein